MHKNLLGYPQQLNIIRILEDTEGLTPPIFDASEILKNPRLALKKICNSIGISFSEKMLKWPKGKENLMVCGASTGIKMLKAPLALNRLKKKI